MPDIGSAPESPESSSGGRRGLESQLDGLLREAAAYSEKHPEDASAGAWWERIPAELPGPGSAAWQLRPEHGEQPEQWRRAAVLFLFCLPEDAEPYLLLTERASGLAKHPGQISLPGGVQEEFDAGPAACALREAQEEVSLDVTRVRLLGSLPPAPVSVSGFMVTPVLASTVDPGVLTPQLGEVESVLKAPVSELVSPEHRRSAVITWRGAVRRSPAFLIDDALIWGFTGILLDRVLDRLGWSGPWDESLEIDPREHQRLG